MVSPTPCEVTGKGVSHEISRSNCADRWGEMTPERLEGEIGKRREEEEGRWRWRWRLRLRLKQVEGCEVEGGKEEEEDEDDREMRMGGRSSRNGMCGCSAA
jgi:hypothetical protein